MGRRPAARDHEPGDVAEAATTEADLAGWYERGLALVDAGRYFEAHEEFELAWRAAAGPERDFFQGLVHVTVSWYQARRGNAVGAARQLEKAERRLQTYVPAHRDLDLLLLLRAVGEARRTVAAGSLDLPAPPLERVRTGAGRSRRTSA